MFPLRVHSYYSLMRGTASPERLCRVAGELGYSALAMTDRDNLYGLWPFLSACRRMNIRPIVGAEITDPGTDDSATLLVRNQTGYVNLCNLLTRRQLDRDFSLAGEILRSAQGVMVLCDRLALLQQWHGKGIEVAADLGPKPTEQGFRLKKWAGKAGVMAVATVDSYTLNEDDSELYRLLRAIDLNTTLSDIDDREAAGGRGKLEAADVYRKRFGMWPDAIEAACVIGDRCSFDGPAYKTIMPPWQCNGRSAEQVLRDDAYEGARLRYGDSLPEPVVERLEHELAIIGSMDFSSYFLVVRDIVHRGRGEHGKRRICGRGSGAASLVAYCLEITNVCPVKHNLYFERFLNPERSDPPDIDIDFAWDERDQVLKEVFDNYGDHVAMVSNHVCFKPRMAIRETAKVFGLPGGEISTKTKRLPWLYRNRGTDLAEQLRQLPALRDQDFNEPWPEILRLSARLIGLPRYLSVHPGGVVITPEPVRNYVPVEKASKGVNIIQWEKDSTEEAGLVKIDLLGNRSLGVIRDCLQTIRTNGTDFDEAVWQPEEDDKTKTNISRGGTMGCFYIESPAMRLLQKKAASGEFEQLVLQPSIIRPAANEFVREYVRRLHGGSYQPLHEKVEDVLDETFGLMVYQEDVSKVAVALADFSHGRADGLRKVLSKKDRNVRLPDYKTDFYEGCKRNNLSTKQIEALWAMMMSFDGYSFCKPHSASYAVVSYQAAYLKSHYPAEFMAAVISNQGGFYSTFAYVSEARRLGLTILPPDVNVSSVRWQGNGKKIRVGLQSVKGVGIDLMERIIHCRKERPYSGCEDFFGRTRPEEDEAVSLINAGALDGFDKSANRPALLYQLASFRQITKGAASLPLFPIKLPLPPVLPAQSRRERLRNQYRVLGFLCDGHPICFFSGEAGSFKMVKADRLHQFVNTRINFTGWLITGKLVSTKTGEVMEFLTFEDETGLVEATFFPKTYRRYAHLLSAGRPYLLAGLVEEDFGAVTLTVQSVRPLTK